MLVKIPFVSSTVFDCLETSESLLVHSVFENGINIQGKDRLIFIGMQSGPSALSVDASLIPVITQCKQGDELFYQDYHLNFKNQGLILDLKFAKKITYNLYPKEIFPYTVDKVSRIILGYDFDTGFDVSTQVLLDTLEYKFEDRTLDYLDYLMGRGKGLTPSGDDFLLGMIAYHHVKPYLSDAFFEKLLLKFEEKPTTDISLNYLKDAYQGLFVQDIIDFFEALGRGDNVVGRIYKIASFGHSSGKDTLAGIVMGMMMEQRTRRIHEE